MRRLSFSLVTALFLCVAGTSRAQIEYVGSTLWAWEVDIDVAGDYAYCAYEPGLRIFDISDPENPAYVAQYFTGKAKGVFVDGDYAYVVDGLLGLVVIDISDPVEPTYAGGVATPGDANKIYVQDGYAFIADGDNGLQIVDVSVPSAPVLAGNYGGVNARDVNVSGDYAYLACGDMLVIDVSDPDNPSFAGIFNSSFSAHDLQVANNYAYVISTMDPFAGPSRLEIVDISEPTGPFSVGSIGLNITDDISVTGGYACVATWDGFRIIDVTDPENPAITGQIGLYGAAVYAVGERLYAGTSQAFMIFDMTDPQNPAPQGEYPTPGEHYNFDTLDGHAYVASEWSGLSILDVTDPANPIFRGYIDSPGPALGAAVNGNYAYLTAYENGLHVIDVSDPADPYVVGTLNYSGNEWDLMVSGSYLYVAATEYGIHIFDLSDPSDPSLTASLSTPSSPKAIYAHEHHAYVIANDQLCIVNVSDPYGPYIASTFDLGCCGEGAFVSGSYAYIADGHDGLKILNISDPSQPTYVGGLDTGGWARSVRVQNGYAYVADGGGGLRLIAVSDPANPVSVTGFGLPGYAMDVSILGDYACVITSAAFMILRFDPACSYIPGDCDHNGVALELNDVVAMISNYRGTAQPFYVCQCGENPPVYNFAACADPDGDCVPNELTDVITEIAAYRGTGETSGCPDCPGSD